MLQRKPFVFGKRAARAQTSSDIKEQLDLFTFINELINEIAHETIN